MANTEELRNMKRQMYSNLEGFLKDWEDYIKKEVEHKHQVSMQCARDAAAEIERDKFIKWLENVSITHNVDFKELIKIKLGKMKK